MVLTMDTDDERCAIGDREVVSRPVADTRRLGVEGAERGTGDSHGYGVSRFRTVRVTSPAPGKSRGPNFMTQASSTGVTGDRM